MGQLNDTTAQINAKLAAVDFDGSKKVDCIVNEITDAGGANAPDVASLTRGGFFFRFPVFDGGSTIEWKTYRVEIPHDARIASGLEVHFRGTPTTDATGTVRMVVEYALQKKAGDVVAGTTKVDTETIVAGGNTAGTEYYFSFPLTTADTGLATMAIGDSLLINIKRDPTQDTYGDDFAQIEFGMHCGLGALGEDI